MNAWETLGVAPGADRATIRSAYFEKIATHSPDKDPEVFKQIRTAYEELTGGATRRTDISATALRRLQHHKETCASPHELLKKEKVMKDELTIQQLIRLTL